MFCLNNDNRFFLYPYPTDMRKSFYTLSGIVTNEMGMNVQSGDAFVFMNRSLTSLKILHAEYGGLVIYNMKLERGRLQLPDIDFEKLSSAHPVIWPYIVMMIQGITQKSGAKSTRWRPKKD